MAWFHSGMDSASMRLCESGAMLVTVDVCKDKCFFWFSDVGHTEGGNGMGW